MSYRCIEDALNKARQYYTNIFWDLGNNKGIMKEGPGCPLALRNTTLGLWRYPGRRRANIIKAKTLGEPEEYDYYFEDDDTLLEWDWPFFNDLVINVKRSFPSESTVRWELYCKEKNRGDSIDVYLADVKVGEDIEEDWSFSQTYSLGKMSTGLKYPPRYQKSMGLVMLELGLADGQKCVNQFDYSASGKYDLYELLWGYGADRDDNWICTETTFHENETHSNWPEGCGFYPYKTRLRASWPFKLIKNADTDEYITSLRDLYIATSITGSPMPPGWDSGPNPGSFQTGPLYDALQAIHLMNKYGADANKASDILYRLNRCDFDGHGPRRYYYWPNSNSSKLPFAGTRPQYASYCLGAFAVAALKWWRLTGSCEWKQKAEEAIDNILRVMVWDNYIYTDGGTYLRPCDTGGCYIGYMNVNGYIYYSWDSFLFQLADILANKVPIIFGEMYRDGSDFVGIGTTSYEGTMMCVKALLDYKNYGQPLMHPIGTTLNQKWKGITLSWTCEQTGEGEHEFESTPCGDAYLYLWGIGSGRIVRLDAVQTITLDEQMSNPKVTINFEHCEHVELYDDVGYADLLAKAYLLNSSDEVLSQTDYIYYINEGDECDKLVSGFEEVDWTHSGTLNAGTYKIKLSLWYRARYAKIHACGYEEDEDEEQINRGILGIMLDLQPSS